MRTEPIAGGRAAILRSHEIIGVDHLCLAGFLHHVTDDMPQGFVLLIIIIRQVAEIGILPSLALLARAFC